MAGMPCYHCGTRQVDPDQGPSPWGRGLLDDHQILICPACQVQRDWTADLDRCRRCGSAHLVRRLDEVECRDCGLIRLTGTVPAARTSSDPSRPGDLAVSPDPELAAEVERALAKVLGRTAKIIAAP
jgi:ribosomal protein L40E